MQLEEIVRDETGLCNRIGRITPENPSPPSQLPASTLLELFLGGYLATPRQRRIGQRRQVGPVPCVHYDYFWQGRHMLADNFFVSPDDGLSGDKLSAVLQAIRAYRPAPENQIFVPLTDTAVSEIMASYGCEEKGPNYLMERPLTEADKAFSTDKSVHQVKTVQDIESYNRIPGGNITLRADVYRQEFRFYYVLDGQIPVAQGRSWRCRPSIAWESHVYTNPNYQRRGFATALMQRIGRDNAQAGIQYSTLLASEAGHRLYRRIGYTDRLTIGCYKMKTKD